MIRRRWGHGLWLRAGISLAASLNGCASGSQPQAGPGLVARPEAPIGTCRATGALTAEAKLDGGGSVADAKQRAETALQAKSGARGDTHLHLEQTDVSGAQVVARGTGYVCEGSVSYGGSLLGSSDPRMAQAPDWQTERSAGASTAARTRPAAQTRSLGHDRSEPGCLEGHVYPMTTPTGLPSDYEDKRPAASLWGCEFNIATGADVQAFAGAQPGRRYAVRHQGVFNAPTVGIYIFQVQAGQPFRLTIGGRVLVDASGAQSVRIELREGEHNIKFEYAYTAGQPFDMQFDVQPPGGTMQPFSTAEGSPFYASQGLRYAGTARLGEDWRELAEMDKGEIRITKQVHFETDSSSIRVDDESEAVLYAVANILKETPGILRLEVQGHTDDQGSPGYNMDLSQKRARAVRDWLVESGIAPHRLLARGYGQTRPLGGAHSEADRARNRRVQFVVLETADGAAARADASGE